MTNLWRPPYSCRRLPLWKNRFWKKFPRRLWRYREKRRKDCDERRKKFSGLRLTILPPWKHLCGPLPSVWSRELPYLNLFYYNEFCCLYSFSLSPVSHDNVVSNK